VVVPLPAVQYSQVSADSDAFEQVIDRHLRVAHAPQAFYEDMAAAGISTSAVTLKGLEEGPNGGVQVVLVAQEV
jgi:hypothetical protein